MKQCSLDTLRIIAVSAIMCFILLPSAAVGVNAESNDGYAVNNPHMIINQIYGSGGASEVVSHDFIELYNPTDKDIDLSGWSVHYRSSSADKTRTDLSWNKLTLSGTVPAHCSYLIRCKESSAYSGSDKIISDYDISWDVALYNKGMSVVLLSLDTSLPSDSVVFDNDSKTPAVEGYVDMLSVAGNDEKPAQVPETYETAVNAWQSKKIGVVRNSFADTDDNSADLNKADYSAEDVSSFFPKSTKYGPWGAPPDRSIKFSADSGFYETPFNLRIDTEDGQLYYTLDGSEPDPNSESTYTYDVAKGIAIDDATKHENTISMRTDTSAGFNLNEEGSTLGGYESPKYNIDKCTVVRVAAYYNDGTHSDTFTNSYFIGFDNRDSIRNLNVLSMVAAPEDLFGYDKGIYVLGANGVFDNAHWWWSNGNFRMKGKEWERKASMEFFDTAGNLIHDQIGGIRIHGGGSRGFAQKSFNLYARDEYDGNKRFNYDFFGTGYLAKKMTLSNGGDDINSKSADYMINTSCFGDKYYGIAKMVPYALFLNGEYWGMYYLTEKYDDRYIENYYQVKGDNVVIIKNGEVEEGEPEDMSLYNQMKSFIVENDMEKEENYEQACNLIDIDSFAHYYATEIYIGRNMDWPISNWATWRARETGSGTYEDGRWRWLIFDLNSGSMGDGLNKTPRSVSDTAITDSMFASLMKNQEFRDKMQETLSEVGTKYLSATIMDEFLDNYLDNYLLALEASHDRYSGKEADSGIEALINDRRLFFENRYSWIMADMEEFAGDHAWDEGVITIHPDYKKTGIRTYTCSVCGKIRTETIPKLEVKKVKPVVKLSAYKYIYTGKVKKPRITVTVNGKTLTTNDYSVSYNTKRYGVGKHTVKVTLKNGYEGSASTSFKILPKRSAVASAAVGKKKMTVKMTTKVWKTGGKVYQIAYKVKGTSKWKYTTTKKQSKVIYKLKKGKIYQVKVRAYKTIGKARHYGAWSKVKVTKKIK